MKLDSILTEANRQSVILVDFQPAYESDDWGYRNALTNACNYLNKAQPSRVTVFFNGMDVGIEDMEGDVAEHYMEYGLDEDMLDNFHMIEKSYAWLRGWMDNGVEQDMIIKTVRYMVSNRLNDSRDIDEEVLEQINNDQYDMDILMGDHIYIPDISLSLLKELSGSLIGGGGKDECLLELQILMNAFNIKYKMVNEWIYGLGQ